MKSLSLLLTLCRHSQYDRPGSRLACLCACTLSSSINPISYLTPLAACVLMHSHSIFTLARERRRAGAPRKPCFAFVFVDVHIFLLLYCQLQRILLAHTRCAAGRGWEGEEKGGMRLRPFGCSFWWRQQSSDRSVHQTRAEVSFARARENTVGSPSLFIIIRRAIMTICERILQTLH